MTASDQRGLALSGATPQQARDFDAITDDYFEYRLRTYPALKALCETAPEFVMAHLFKAAMLLSMGTNATVPAALASIKHATAAATTDTRERHHLAAITAWAHGNTTAACRHWDDILTTHPLDLLALKLQHFTLFWMGEPQRMQAAAARALPKWEEATPGHPNLLAMYAFALEETGDYQQAEHHGREAAARAPDDLWALHAVAHVLDMQGRLTEGIQWLDASESQHQRWHDRNPFRAHMWWHAALFAFEKGEYDRALALYDTLIRPTEPTFYLDIQNTVSLLARLEIAGVNVGDRWHDLADFAHEFQGDHVLMLTEPHCAIAFARTGRQADTDQHLASLRQFAADPTNANNPAAALITPLVAPLCQAIADHYQGNHATAAKTLLALRPNLPQLGGSHTQRDLIDHLLIAATTATKSAAHAATKASNRNSKSVASGGVG